MSRRALSTVAVCVVAALGAGFLFAPNVGAEQALAPGASAAGSPSSSARDVRAGDEKSPLSYVFGLYGKYSECKENIAVGQPCLASDSSNIREIIKQLGQLQATVEKNQEELLAALSEIKIQLSEQQLRAFISDLRGVEANAGQAAGAWAALLACQAAQSQGQTTCQEYLDGLQPDQVPIEEALETNRYSFLEYANALPKSLQEKILIFTGTRGATSKDSLAYAIWKLEKYQQEIAVGVTDKRILGGDLSPIVTYEMARSVNSQLDYYANLLTMYADVLVTRTQLLRDEATPGSTEYKKLTTELRLLDSTIDRRILPVTDESVEGVRSLYAVSYLSPGQIMMAGPEGRSVTVYWADKDSDGSLPMTATNMNSLGQGLKIYSSYDKVREARPKSFPESEWSVVRIPVQQVEVCLTRANIKCAGQKRPDGDPDNASYFRKYGEVGSTWVYLLSQYGKAGDWPEVNMFGRMKLLNAAPTFRKSRDDGGATSHDTPLSLPYFNRSWPYAEMQFGQEWWNKQMKWPATYDWKQIDRKSVDKGWDNYLVGDRSIDVGWGQWIDVMRDGVNLSPADADRVLDTVEGNKLVQWPAGMPSPMPANWD